MTPCQIAKAASVHRLRKANIIYLGSAEGRGVSRESRDAVARALNIGDLVTPTDYNEGVTQVHPAAARPGVLIRKIGPPR